MRVTSFHGAKAALLLGDDLLVLRRDRLPGIPWPGAIDLPGGGREGLETPEACVTREVREETGLLLTPHRFFLRHCWSSETGVAWFFAAELQRADMEDLQLGDEGEAVWLMPVSDYLASGEVIANHKPLVHRARSRRLT